MKTSKVSIVRARSRTFRRGALLAAAVAAGAASHARAATATWLGITSDWFEPTNWSTLAVPTGVDTAVLPGTPVISQPDLGSNSARLFALNIDNTAAPYTVSGANALFLTGGGISVTGGGTAVLNPFIYPIRPSIWNVNADTSLQLEGRLAGTQLVTKGGTGTLVLDYLSNNFAGGFAFDGGTVQNGGSGSLIAAFHSNTITMDSGAKLNGDGVSGSQWNIGALGGAGTVAAAGKRLNLSLLDDKSSSASIAAGTTSIGISTQGIGTQTLTGAIDMTGAIVISNSSNLTLAGDAVFNPKGVTNYTAATGTAPDGHMAALIKGGYLTLDNSAVNNNDRVQGQGYLGISGGGGLRFIGNAAGTDENFDSMPIAPFGGAANVQIVHNAGSSAATVIRLPGLLQVNTTATLDFSANVPLGSVNGPRVMLATPNAYAFFNGFGSNQSRIVNDVLGIDGTNGFPPSVGMFTVNNRNDFAVYDNTKGIIAATYSALPTTPGGSAGANVLLTTSGNTAGTGSGTNFALNTLKISPSSAGQSLDINGGGSLQVGAYILTGPNTFTISSSGGGMIAGLQTRYFHIPDPAGTLILNADLGGAGPTGTGGVQNNPVTKDGPGTLVLGAPTTFTNTASVNINILDGALRVKLNNGTQVATLPSNTTVRIRGGVLEIEGGGTFSRFIGTGNNRVSWGSVGSDSGSGGFAAYNGSARVDLNSLDTRDELKWRSSNFVFEDQALVFGSLNANSVIEFFDHINLSDNGSTTDSFASVREIRVIDNPNSTADKAVISGEIRSNAVENGGLNADFLKSGNGVLELTAASNSYLGNTIVTGGTLHVTGSLASTNYVLKGGTFVPDGGVPSNANVLLKGGNATFSSARTVLDSISGTAGTLALTSSATRNAKVLTVNSLNLSANAKVDLANNGMIVDYVAGEPSPVASVRGALRNAYAGGTWSGPGITSSAAAATGGSTAIGYVEASQLTPAQRAAFFPGDPIAIDDSSVLLKYTKFGDATLNGTVDFEDLVALAQNYNNLSGDRVWTQGDFTYDGNVDFNDLVLIAQNYNTSLPALPVPGASIQFETDLKAAFAQVPEPAALSVLALASLFTRKRRKIGHE